MIKENNNIFETILGYSETMSHKTNKVHSTDVPP
jgi:hypothetical protein